MSFEEYRPDLDFNRSHNKRPTMAFSKNVITLNRPAREALGEPRRVALSWDEERQVVGIRPKEGGLALTRKSKGAGGAVSSGGFYRFAGIQPHGRAEAWMEGDMLVAEIVKISGQATQETR